MPTRCESCQKQLVDDQKQKMCDVNACSNHSRHGYNNIKEDEHPWGAKCNDIVHNVHKWVTLERNLKILQVSNATRIVKVESVITKCHNIHYNSTKHHNWSSIVILYPCNYSQKWELVELARELIETIEINAIVIIQIWTSLNDACLL